MKRITDRYLPKPTKVDKTVLTLVLGPVLFDDLRDHNPCRRPSHPWSVLTEVLLRVLACESGQSPQTEIVGPEVSGGTRGSRLSLLSREVLSPE